MARYRHHKYTWTKPFGSVRHQWELVGPEGALHFHVTLSDSFGPSCGLEYHHTDTYRQRTGYRRGEAPDHIDCPMTGGRCWHDGTSLYANEHVWPLVEHYLRSGEHEAIFRILEGEADERFGARRDEEAA